MVMVKLKCRLKDLFGGSTPTSEGINFGPFGSSGFIPGACQTQQISKSPDLPDFDFGNSKSATAAVPSRNSGSAAVITRFLCRVVSILSFSFYL